MPSLRANSDRIDRGSCDLPIATELCTELPIDPPSPDAIYRYLGYTAAATPRLEIAWQIRRIVEDVYSHLQARGAYSLYPVTGRTSAGLTCGSAVIVGRVSEFMAAADRVAVFVVTAGEGVCELATEARRQGDPLRQWIVDAVGSWAAEAAADALMQRVRIHATAGESLTLRYSPGYCGMDLAQQRTLFALVPAAAIGAELLPSLLMRPLKSISGIIGIGPHAAVNVNLTPCDQCDRAGCHMRR